MALEFGILRPKSKFDWSSESDSYLFNQQLFSLILFKDFPFKSGQNNSERIQASSGRLSKAIMSNINRLQ